MDESRTVHWNFDSINKWSTAVRFYVTTNDLHTEYSSFLLLDTAVGQARSRNLIKLIGKFFQPILTTSWRCDGYPSTNTRRFIKMDLFRITLINHLSLHSIKTKNKTSTIVDILHAILFKYEKCRQTNGRVFMILCWVHFE